MLAATVQSTTPLPVPPPPAVTLIKPLLLTAVQAQLVPLAVMMMLLEPPPALKLALVETRETLHAAAPCVMVSVCPVTVMEPVWLKALVLAATE